MTFLRRYAPVLALVLFPSLLLAPIFAGSVFIPAHLLADLGPWKSADPATLVPWNPLQIDGLIQFYPWRLFYSQSIHQGFIPLWNPHQFCGTPFLANSQSAVIYPLTALFAVLPVKSAFGVSDLLHLSLTGIFLYLLLVRSFGLSRMASVLGGAVWQLSMWQTSWLALPSFLDTSCWMPLALLLADRVAQRPSVARASALGGVLGLMLLAGHLQVALYGLLLTATFAIWRAVERRSRAISIAGCAVVALVFMVLIAAPQLLPAVELSRVSHRSGGVVNLAAYHGYLKLAMPLFQSLTIVMPRFFGWPSQPGSVPGISSYWGATNYAENACYVGIAPFVLAVLAVSLQFRLAAAVRFFSVAALAALLVAVGSPLAGVLFFCVPGFGQTGSPARILCLWALCMAVLAAHGLDALLALRGGTADDPGENLQGARDDAGIGKPGSARSVAREQSPKPVWVFATPVACIVLLVAGCFGLLATRLRLSDLLSSAVNDFRLLLALSIALSAVVAAFLAGRVTARRTAILLIGVSVVDLIGVGFSYNAFVTPAQVYPRTPLIDWLVAHADTDRIMPVNREWSLYQPPANTVLPPNTATVYGLDDVQGYDSLQTKQYMAFAAAMDAPKSPSPRENGNMLFVNGGLTGQSREADVKWIVTPTPIPGVTPAFTDGTTSVYEDEQPSSRAQAVLALHERANIAVVPCSTHVIGPTRVDITVPSTYVAGGTVIGCAVADQWYPGWTVEDGIANSSVVGNERSSVIGPSVDGPFTQITCHAPSVNLPITFKLSFQPNSFRLGLYLADVGVAALVGMATLIVYRRRTLG